jgi:hypothetical protein
MSKTTSAIDALDYALYICKIRSSPIKNDSYNAACADIAIFIEAAKERIQNSGELHDYATTQGE